MGKREDCNDIGNVGELKAQTYFTRKGYEIYSGALGNEYFDFVAIKARHRKTPEVKTVEVKTTRTRNKSDTGWTFNIRRSYKDQHFDKTKLDYLALYVYDLDRIYIVDAKKVKQKREYLLLDETLGEL